MLTTQPDKQVDGGSSFGIKKLGSIPRSAADVLSDVDLLEALASGSVAGFGHFYHKFASVLFSLTCSILGDTKEAEDVLQEAFLEMSKQSSRFDPARNSLFSWAVMIARSCAINRVRRRARCDNQSKDAVVASSVTDDNLQPNDERDQMRALLPSLPPVQREAIELAFFSAMTQLDIAQTLHVSLGTVKALIGRGLMALRSRINASAASGLARA